MSDKPLGVTESFVQVLNGIGFYVHCTQDCDYVTKIISSHGVLDEIQDHPTWWLVDGTWKTFKYPEPFSRHNRAKHWVDNVNNHCHYPIGLEEIWATKWWPNQQFTFLLLVAEANAVQSQAHGRKEGRKEGAELTLNFQKQLAKMFNKLGDNDVAPTSPICFELRRTAKHEQQRKLVGEGKWNATTQSFNQVKTPYLRKKIFNCAQTMREYCSCAPARTLCRGCFALNLEEHGI
jgi:hypothetical protein